MVFEGFRAGVKYWGKYSKIMFFAFLERKQDCVNLG